MIVNWVLEMFCVYHVIWPLYASEECVKLCYSFGECRFEEQREGYFRETRGIQKTREMWRQEDTE